LDGGESSGASYLGESNTDTLIKQTSCVHFHIADDFLAQHLKLEAGDDASHARWLDISDAESDFNNLYASHRDMVIRALMQDPAKFGAAIKLIKL
jgi:hypothetical protein